MHTQSQGILERRDVDNTQRRTPKSRPFLGNNTDLLHINPTSVVFFLDQSQSPTLSNPETTMSAISIISSILGWIYVLLWSISFYPQALTNRKRKSSSGLSIDFTFLNALGLTAYTVFNAVLLYSPVVRAQYASRIPGGAAPPVQFNDLVYAAHGAGISLVMFSQTQWPQMWGFRGSNAALSLSAIGVSWACIAVIYAAVGGVLTGVSERWEWLDVVSITVSPSW